MCKPKTSTPKIQNFSGMLKFSCINKIFYKHIFLVNYWINIKCDLSLMQLREFIVIVKNIIHIYFVSEYEDKQFYLYVFYYYNSFKILIKEYKRT